MMDCIEVWQTKMGSNSIYYLNFKCIGISHFWHSEGHVTVSKCAIPDFENA